MLDRRRFLAGGLGVLGSACATSTRAPESSRVARPGPADASPEAHTESMPPFEMHSGFWLNLHHYLYGQAASGDQAVEQAPPLAGDIEPVSPNDRLIWDGALAEYERLYATRDLLFDDELSAVRASLAAQESAVAITLSEKSAGLARVLQSAAGVYRAHAWPKHDRGNIGWMASVRPLVERHGAAIMARLAGLYRTPWPADRVRVDVVPSSNWAGAYTSLDPVHITIASKDSGNQGAYALEILFHEASHGMMRPLRDAVTAESARQGKREPPQLWHAILFYSTGIAVQEAVGEHVMYAERAGLWKGVWAAYSVAFVRSWQPYIDGKDSFESALAAMIRGLPEAAKEG